MGRRIDAGRDRDRPGQHEAEGGERQRQPELLADEVDVGPLVFERQAEVAMQQVFDPPGVLDDDRLIEAVLPTQRLELLEVHR
jgi:hypothetical protein